MERVRFLSCLRAALITLLISCAGYAEQTWYVDDDAPGGSGTSWPTAFQHLTDALAAAAPGDEVRVAQGVYRPDQGAGRTPGDRSATFEIFDALTIKGGHAGFGAPDPDARNIVLFETVLSGDLTGDDTQNFGNRDDNSRHIVHLPADSLSDPDPAILDGLTISAGNADDPAPLFVNGQGAGLFVERLGHMGASGLVVRDCRFVENWASVSGGGVHLEFANESVFSRCTFRGNRADENSLFISGGGGVAQSISVIGNTFDNCIFRNNLTEGTGGGLFNFDAMCHIRNCVFVGNQAETDGGGLGTVGNVSQTFAQNSVFRGNTVGASTNQRAQIQVILFSIFDYCIVEDWDGAFAGDIFGTGSFDADPLFADASAGDFHLLPNSPAIDTGHPNFVAMPGETDIDGEPRLMGCGVDIGVDEVPSGAMQSGDFNADGATDPADVPGCVQALLAPGAMGECVGDLNGDGRLDGADIAEFLQLIFGG